MMMVAAIMGVWVGLVVKVFETVLVDDGYKGLFSRKRYEQRDKGCCRLRKERT